MLNLKKFKPNLAVPVCAVRPRVLLQGTGMGESRKETGHVHEQQTGGRRGGSWSEGLVGGQRGSTRSPPGGLLVWEALLGAAPHPCPALDLGKERRVHLRVVMLGSSAPPASLQAIAGPIPACCNQQWAARMLRHPTGTRLLAPPATSPIELGANSAPPTSGMSLNCGTCL